MNSVVYVEESYIAGLLEGYFVATENTKYIVADLPERGNATSEPEELALSERNNSSLRKYLNDRVDLILIQSDNIGRIEDLLRLINENGNPIPTLVITALQSEVAKRSTFAHNVTMQQLLEGNLGWHIALAQTAQKVQKIRKHFEEGNQILILMQDDPDPDAIASGLALRQVLRRNAQTATLGTFGKVTRPENIAMVKLLGIEIKQIKIRNIKKFDRIALVDLQPTHIKNTLPRIDLIVDHHPEESEGKAIIRDIRSSYGATSTILSEYLLSQGSSISTRLATALLYGIKSDTFILARETNQWDVEAFSYLYKRANHNLLRQIERPELPSAALDSLSKALKARKIRERVAFVSLGRIQRDDLVPQLADFCLQFEGADWALVSGIYKSNLILSVRNIGDIGAAGKVVKKAFGDLGSAGGHASMAKAIMPLAKLCEKWNTDRRNTRLLNSRIQTIFLKAIRESR